MLRAIWHGFSKQMITMPSSNAFFGIRSLRAFGILSVSELLREIRNVSPFGLDHFPGEFLQFDRRGIVTPNARARAKLTYSLHTICNHIATSLVCFYRYPKSEDIWNIVRRIQHLPYRASASKEAELLGVGKLENPIFLLIYTLYTVNI
jgi:hypothetical protein